MGALFSKKKAASRVTEQDKAVLQLKHQRDQLKQYQKKIENKLASDKVVAIKLLKDGKKDRAKLLLKKKRYQETLLQNTDAQLEHLERLTHDIEFAQIEQEVLNGLKQGNVALKKMHDSINIDEIERIMDETREGIEKQQEIDILLSGQLTEEDEIAVENELEEMLQESLPEVPDDELVETNLPEVPTEEIQEKPAKEKRPERVALAAS